MIEIYQYLLHKQEDASPASSAEAAVNRDDDDDDVSDTTTTHGGESPPSPSSVKKHYLINVGHGVYQRAEEADVTSNLSPPDESFERPQHRLQVRGVSGRVMCHCGSVLVCAAEPGHRDVIVCCCVTGAPGEGLLDAQPASVTSSCVVACDRCTR